MTYKLDVSVVREAARGRWAEIFSRLASQLKQAQAVAGRHVPCPVHGGKDGFRLFPDYAVSGSAVCNSCGIFRDGFAVLQWLHGWSFKEALEAVAGVLMLGVDAGKRLISRESCADVWRGPVLHIGMHDIDKRTLPGFVLRIFDELQNRQVILGGEDLHGACRALPIHVATRIEVRRLAREVWRSARGEIFERFVWQVEILPSRREEKARDRLRTYRTIMRKRVIRQAWADAEPYDPCNWKCLPLGRYLFKRGLQHAPMRMVMSLRFAEHVFDEQSGRGYPAMVAAVQNVDGTIVNVHRTLITAEGLKAPVKVVKRLCRQPEDSTISGAAIHFAEPDKMLAVAEGIETALAVATGTGLPCWACVSANGLRAVRIPAGVEHVFIFADKDASGVGQTAAADLQRRLTDEGFHAVIVEVPYDIPKGMKGIDWADVLQKFGPRAFPTIWGRGAMGPVPVMGDSVGESVR